ncbi:MAG: hypothetical protein ACT4PM_05135 [Gemmatimonadales bacterium]
MIKTPSSLGWTIALWVAPWLCAQAQVQAPRSTPSLGLYVVPGAVLQTSTHGDEDKLSATNFGPTIGARLQARRFVIEGAYHFVTLPGHPWAPDKRYADMISLEVGLRFGRRVYVRPTAGFLFGARHGAPLLGLAIGREVRAGRLHVSPELTIRGFWEPYFYGLVAGVQVPVGVRF